MGNLCSGGGTRSPISEKPESSEPQTAEPEIAEPEIPEDVGGVLLFSFKGLQRATDNFSESRLLGKGGFGEVFRAEVRLREDSPDLTTVAVKRCKELSPLAREQIQTEVRILQNLDHPNLVNLLGVCPEKYILVYEFMGGGDVDKLMDACFEGQREFTWEQRLKVALEAARGLAHLHENNLIHRDFKPANLLLDEDMVAKITDFGMVRLGPTASDYRISVETRVMGSPWYIDPTYMAEGTLQVKSDVFSFGIFLVELMTGTRARDEGAFKEKYKLLRANTPKGDVTTFVDPRLEGNYNVDDVKKLAVFTKYTSHEDRTKRPAMTDILDRLEKMVNP